MTEQVYIVAAKRTVWGRFLGSLAKLGPVELAEVAARACLDGIEPGSIDQVILGSVLTAGCGMNIARQLACKLGLPQRVPGYTINTMCASGLHAVALAQQAIAAGQASVVLCGGTESMSTAPHLLTNARRGYKLGSGELIDAMLRDGLIDPRSGEHMALTAERIANERGITRERQDAFALESQRRAAAAENQGVFDCERIEATGLLVDEHARPDTTIEALAGLKPAFDPSGTVTAGNASGINDGAALLLVASARACEQHGWQPLCAIGPWTLTGCDPDRMGMGPVHAIRQLAETGTDLSNIDRWELNEAFAAQAIACQDELAIDPAAVNVCGGSIALGHPIGASGARLATHLAHRIYDGDCSKTVASLCVGGGMGIAMVLHLV